MANLDDEVESLVAQYGIKGNTGTKCAAGNSPHRDLIEALNARGVSKGRIALILREQKKFDIGESAVGRHLSRVCKCPTS